MEQALFDVEEFVIARATQAIGALARLRVLDAASAVAAAQVTCVSETRLPRMANQCQSSVVSAPRSHAMFDSSIT
jgi:hypothetical protein